MRQAVAQAIHHAQYRTTFQKHLIDHALMANVLADLAIEAEAATLLALRLAQAYDDESEAALTFRRVATPAAKFWICKRAPTFAAEAMEVLGGNGYVEDFNLARIYREVPVNSIWEGSGNIMCLDVLRALARAPLAAGVLADEMRDAATADRRLAQFIDRMRAAAASTHDEAQARVFVRDLVVALQASLLIRHAPQMVADAFCASRLGGGSGTFGMLPPGVDARRIIARAAPILH
jgi:putative acyl-CoA dehydrogenase